MMPTDDGNEDEQQQQQASKGSIKDELFKRSLSNGGHSPDGAGNGSTKRQKKTSVAKKKAMQ